MPPGLCHLPEEVKEAVDLSGARVGQQWMLFYSIQIPLSSLSDLFP